MRRLAPLLVLALAGCGSAPAAELPAPAGAPVSPSLTERPAGDVQGLTERPESVGEPSEAQLAGTCRDRVAAEMLDRGRRIAVLCGRERMLEIYDAATLRRLGRVGAGIGPAGLATDGVELLYVTDVLGEALLVFHLRPFELIRRVHLGGAPYAIAYDKERWGLWIALPGQNRIANYSAGNRPVIRETLPSIRAVDSLFVTRDSVTATGQDELQVLRPRSR